MVVDTTPACLLIPKLWNQYESLVRDYVVRSPRDHYAPFTNLQDRNIMLRDPSSQHWCHARQPIPQAIISLFDGLSHNPHFDSVAQDCFRLSSNYRTILTCCLEWCSTIERNGTHRPYAAARLMRLWIKMGIDIQGHILDFLGSNPEVQGLNKSHIYKLVSELVCSGDFSVGRYLQWLIARGGLRHPQAPGPVSRISSAMIPLTVSG